MVPLDRAHWELMLPIIKAYVEGKYVTFKNSKIYSFCAFDGKPEDYKIIQEVNNGEEKSNA